MKKLKYIIIVAVIALIYWGIPKNEPGKSKEQEWKEYIAKKDTNYKNSEESPIKDKENFKGLNYFAYNEKLVIDFKVDRSREGEIWVFPNSDGSNQSLEILGTIQKEIEGQMISLLVFKHKEGGFFLPFKDKTAPEETYGGGKYIDVDPLNLNNNLLTVNFNYSYFPYCAYSEGFACPLPPLENNLPLRIEAGEKF